MRGRGGIESIDPNRKEKKNTKESGILYGPKTDFNYEYEIKDNGERGDIMRKKIYNTNIEVKREHFSKFAKLISNQFEHGGDKYKVSEGSDEEMTDMVCRKYPGKSGVDWILGTIDKYTGRFKNFEREKDLLKIATFAYIAWLKKGYHLEEEHDEDVKK